MRARKAWLVLTGLTAATVGLLALRSPSHAFDHQDTVRTTTDTASDIADIYAFMRPNGVSTSTHLVIMMTFAPGATGVIIDRNVDYTFFVRGFQAPQYYVPVIPDQPDAQVTCSFPVSTPQKVVCSVAGTYVSAVVDQVDPSTEANDVRVFAGLRSDPAFADVAKVRETIQTGQSKFVTPGVNSFQGKNVMALVLEINIEKVFFGGDAGAAAAAAPYLAVTGVTKRN